MNFPFTNDKLLKAHEFLMDVSTTCEEIPRQSNYTEWHELRNELLSKLPNEVRREIHYFVSKFKIWLATTVRNEIAKFVANFGNFKRITVCQKFCETHCLWNKIKFE